MASYLLKASNAQMDRWKAAAANAGYSLAEWLRAAADHRAAGPTEERPTATVRGPAATLDRRTRRAGLCEHRVPPDQHCKRCDP